MTNADKIRSMTNKELAEFLEKTQDRESNEKKDRSEHKNETKRQRSERIITHGNKNKKRKKSSKPFRNSYFLITLTIMETIEILKRLHARLVQEFREEEAEALLLAIDALQYRIDEFIDQEFYTE